MEIHSVAEVKSVTYYPTLQIVATGKNTVRLSAYDETGGGSHLNRSVDEAPEYIERWLETGKLT